MNAEENAGGRGYDEARPGSVWATGQESSRVQRRGYVPGSVAHPAKMLPAIARHAIAAYTAPGDMVLDPMCGIGTSLVEAVAAGRDAVGVEYEPRWARLAEANLAHSTAEIADTRVSGRVFTGDARDLTAFLPREYAGRVDLVLTSPPYGSSLHGQVTAVPGEGVVKTGDAYGPDRRDRGNLAHEPLPGLADGLVRIFAGCRVFLRPGGFVAVTARPIRRHGSLIDIPGMVITAGVDAGLEPFERCVALLAAWRPPTLTARPSFFALDYARKTTGAGRATAVIVHEDVLVFTNPATLPGPRGAVQR